MIPVQRNLNFCGRGETLNRIETALSPKQPPEAKEGLKSFSICGMGGMGKTEVAAEYASSRKSDYDAVFWVYANSRLETQQAFETIAKALGFVIEGHDSSVIRAQVLEWFSNPVKSYDSDLPSELAAWLLIFDNVDDMELMYDFWPLGSSGSILITSRDPLSKTYLASNGVVLDPFSIAEGAEFPLKMTRYENNVKTREQALEIAQQLGNLPLALTRIARVIMRQDLSFERISGFISEDAHVNCGRLFHVV